MKSNILFDDEYLEVGDIRSPPEFHHECGSDKIVVVDVEQVACAGCLVLLIAVHKKHFNEIVEEAERILELGE